MKTSEQDNIRLEPLLILTLVLLIGAAFHQGVFQEVMAQAGAMAALCLLHLALMGWVEHLGRHLAALLRKPPSQDLSDSAAQDPEGTLLDFSVTPSDIEFLCGATKGPVSPCSQDKPQELSVWTSGQCLIGTSPISKQLSRF